MSDAISQQLNIIASTVKQIAPSTARQFTHKVSPHSVCPISSSSLSNSFLKIWPNSDTIANSHNNARLIYNIQRNQEDSDIKNHRNGISSVPGLAIKRLGHVMVHTSEFPTASVSETYTGSVSMPANDSVEAFGYFVPKLSGSYVFNIANANPAGSVDDNTIWIDDIALYEYSDGNKLTNNQAVQLNAGRYYPIRCRWINATQAAQANQIMVTLNGRNVVVNVDGNNVDSNNQTINSYFTILKKDGIPYLRKLLYYGFVKDGNTDNYFCYFYNNDPTSTALSRIGYDVVVKYRNINSDSNPQPNYKFLYSNEYGNLNTGKAPDGEHDVTTLGATYGAFVPRKMDWWNNWANVTKQFNALGDTTIKGGTYNRVYGVDPAPGYSKMTLGLNMSTMKPELATNKQISVNNNGQVVVEYANDPNLTSNLVYGTPGSMLTVGDDGTVTFGNITWFQLPPSEVANLATNKRWQALGLPNSLPPGKPLSRLVSHNGKCLLKLSKGTLIFKYSLSAYVTNSFANYSNLVDGTLVSLYLYRPDYSDLDGKLFVQNDTDLTRVYDGYSNLKFSSFDSGQQSDTVLNPASYAQTKQTATSSCAQQCQTQTTCGHYFTDGKQNCMLDQSNITNPPYTNLKTSVNKLYRKQYIMKDPISNNYLAFNPQDDTKYLSYNLIDDQKLSAPTTSFVTYIPPDKQVTIDQILDDPESILADPSRVSSLSPSQAMAMLSAVSQQPVTTDDTLNGASAFTTTKGREGFADDIPPMYSRILPAAPDTTVEEGRISDLQAIMFQQNIMYSAAAISAVTFMVAAIVLGRK